MDSSTRNALADCKGTYILFGAQRAEEIATDYLRVSAITPGDYIALARWAEGRESYIATLFPHTPPLLHAHVETGSSDCDGSYSGTHDEFFNDEELAESGKEINDFSEIHFMGRLIAKHANPYAIDHATVTITEHGFEVNEATEEGGRYTGVRWCREDCEPEGATFRDATAEAAGY